jgi:hypothetical protein
MRVAEPRFDRYDKELSSGDIPVLKLRAVGDVLAEGGTMYVGASDAGSAFVPAVVASAEGDDEPGYNAAVPGMPTDMYAKWSRYAQDAGADPDRIVMGVNPTQFQELTIDISEAEEAAGITVEAGLDLTRANIERAPQYAGTGRGFGTHFALFRKRQWIQHPTDAWHALTGSEAPLDTEAVEGLRPDEAGEDLRPDGTSSRWDAPAAPGQVSRAAIDGSALGPPATGVVQAWVDDMRRLEAGDGPEVVVVLLPFTPQLAGVAGDPDFERVREELIRELGDGGVDVLDLTGLALSVEQFSDPLHYSRDGAELLSTRVGQWLAEESTSSG